MSCVVFEDGCVLRFPPVKKRSCLLLSDFMRFKLSPALHNHPKIRDNRIHHFFDFPRHQIDGVWAFVPPESVRAADDDCAPEVIAITKNGRL